MTDTDTKNSKITNVDTIIGKNLKRIRLSKRLTQDKVADAVGISFQQIQKYEKGRNRISASTLLKIAEYMEEPLTSFFIGVHSNDEHPFASMDTDDKDLYETIGLLQKIEGKEIRSHIKSLLKNFVKNQANA